MFLGILTKKKIKFIARTSLRNQLTTKHAFFAMLVEALSCFLSFEVTCISIG
jgi:hypothetical protein